MIWLLLIGSVTVGAVVLSRSGARSPQGMRGRMGAIVNSLRPFMDQYLAAKSRLSPELVRTIDNAIAALDRFMQEANNAIARNDLERAEAMLREAEQLMRAVRAGIKRALGLN